MPSTIILEQVAIKNKIRRMAFQVYEANLEERDIYIAGIADSGYKLALILSKMVELNSNINVTICKVSLNKKDPIGSVTADIPIHKFKNKSVILVDDVLNSGSTLLYAATFFLQVPLKQFKTAVLVDRNHKKFPVKADYKGISLSTSINENIIVAFEPEMTVSLI